MFECVLNTPLTNIELRKFTNMRQRVFCDIRRSSLPDMFYKKGVLKYFAKFKGKTPVAEPFFLEA